jgi:hypothetical protein
MIKFITQMSRWGYRHASIKNILIITILFLTFSHFIIPRMARQITPSGDPQLLDVQFGYTPDQAYSTLAAIESQGRTIYLIMLAVVDGIYAFIYGMLLILCASFFLNKSLSQDSILRLLNIIAVDAIIFDLLENVSLIYLLLHFPHRADGVARLASLFGMIKWIMITLSIGVVVIGTIGWAISRKKPTNQKNRESL